MFISEFTFCLNRNFKTSIHNYLRQVSGGSFGCVLGPNNSE